MLAGIIVALLAFPAFGLAGLVVQRGTGSFSDLPTALKIPPPAQNSYLYANDGKTLITTFYADNRTPVPMSKISKPMQRAIVAAEDTRFYLHNGVDPRGVIRALVANQRAGEVSEGASTLTMQYVRNVLVDSAKTPEQVHQATEQTAARKLREMRYAMALEKRFSKSEILNRYLNIVYFGHGAYGVSAAARVYFDTTPDRLTVPQAAMLAGLVKSPNAYDPTAGPEGHKAALHRRAYVLDSMATMHYISHHTAQRAKKSPLGLHPGYVPNGCTAVPPDHLDWGFFCDYFVQWWDQQKAFGANTAEREHKLKTGGYKIITSMDPDVQNTAHAAAQHIYPNSSPKALPIVAIEPGSGHVIAMSVNRNYSLKSNPDGQRNHPNTVDQLIAGGGDIVGYQTGSTMKMFTMLAALKDGKPLNTGFHAPSPLHTNYPVSSGGCGGAYCPVNDNPSWMDGYRTMWDGYGRSVNTYFVWLQEQIGAEKAVKMAQELGIHFRAKHDAELAQPDRAHGWGAFTLGVADVTPLELANGYATVANEGVYCTPLPALSITDSRGHRSSATTPACHRVVSADIARAATDAARCPVEDHSFYGKCNGGTAPDVGRMIDRPVAGKTGSAEKNSTESFVGFTPNIAVEATACTPDDPWDAVGAGVSEAVDIAVAKTMKTALKTRPVEHFHKPSHKIAFGH